jgi:APA family basic amino acid/polyamine antiporter
VLTLRRELGKWDLTAIGVNQVIGSAVFVLPSQVAAHLGNWSPVGFLAIGFASLLVALCFAEAGSRFDGTGGSFLYTRAAFGRFVAFEVGWMQWFTRITAQASVANAVPLVLAFYWPSVAAGIGRASIITGVTLALGWINLRGIRQSSLVINLLTIAKVAPLALFVIVGVWFMDAGRLTPVGSPTLAQVSTGALLLIFAFGGYDTLAIPAGEAISPRRHVPFAFVATILAVTAIMGMAQVVATGVLPDLTRSQTPIADASLLLVGAAGGLLVTAGSVVSMVGNNMGQVLAGSRMLFALAEHGELPRAFGVIHPRYRTPSTAVVFTTLAALGIALSGSFAVLAIASAVGRLLVYTGTCAATLRLRASRFNGVIAPAAFVIPMGPIVPTLAIVVSLLILAAAGRDQLLGGAATLGVGAVLFAANSVYRRRIDAADAGELSYRA